jgi:site-specific DNA recombinase
MTAHTALYCRISKDKAGRREGVEIQAQWGQDYAAAAWPAVPVVVYTDNDISAANGDHRPGFERLRDAISDGQVAHLWCVEQSRLERREAEWFTFAAELDAAGIREVHTNRDGIVQVGGVVAGIKAVINAAEVRRLKERINDRLDANAAAGQPAGSTPFGYRHAVKDDGTKTYAIVPAEAGAIRYAAGRVLAGWSLAAVTAELAAQGITGPHRVKVRDAAGAVVTDEHGKPVTRPGILSAGSVRSMLTKPTIAGRRVHRGVDVGTGNWEPILDYDTWQACRAKLTGPRLVRRGDGGLYPVTVAHNGNTTGRKYTLTGGLAVCGVCGAPMIGTAKQHRVKVRDEDGAVVMNPDTGKPVTRVKRVSTYLQCMGGPGPYVSREKGGQGGCTGIMLERTEQEVADRLFAELDKPEFLDLVAGDDHAERREAITAALEGIDGQRRELAQLWADGERTTDEWQTARNRLDEREKRLRAELADVPPPVGRISVAEAREAWPDMTLGERREFLRLCIDQVVISRARPGTAGFDPDRITVHWRQR